MKFPQMPTFFGESENPYAVLDPIGKIKGATSFSDLYAKIREIQKEHKDFCPPEMMQSIYDFDNAGDSRLVSFPAMFNTITRTFGLRDKVMDLVRQFPLKQS